MPHKGFSFGKKKRNVKPRGHHAKATQPDSDSSCPDTLDEPVDGFSFPSVSEDRNVNDAMESSRAEEKFEHFSDHFETPVSSEYYGIFHSSFLSSLLDFVTCPTCSTASLSVEVCDKKGLAFSYGLFCSVCDKVVWSAWTSPRNSASGRFDIDQRTVLACKEAGILHTKLSTLFGIMSIPTPLHHKPYQEISADVHHAAISAAEDSMKKAAEVAQQRSRQENERTSSSGCPVITVSYDGTWHKRGHSSHTGVGIAIDFNSGLVLDAQVINNFCAACARGHKKDSPNYETWFLSHLANCMKNFDGSSNAMEVEAARHIFSRSIRKRGLVYGTMLCDGDSKAFNEVNKSAGYDLDIIRENCINHIAKRMFNALDSLKKSHKSKLNRKLTQPNIEKITNVYAKSLKDNAPNVENMKRGVLGSFLHMASTDEKPNHRLCPLGETSWCHYNRSLATNSPIRPHTPTIKPGVSMLVYPIIKRLSEPELLARCAKMGTQNAIESFNSLIWHRCPKTDFGNKSSIETVTYLAILAFNTGRIGIKFVMDEMGIPWTSTNKDFCLSKHKEKIRKARKRSLGMSKWKRKNLKKRQIEENHQRQETEGTTYESGGFNG